LIDSLLHYFQFPLKAHQNEVKVEEIMSLNFEAQAKKYKEYEEAAKKLNDLVIMNMYHAYIPF